MKAIGLVFVSLLVISAGAYAQQAPTQVVATSEQTGTQVSVTCTEDALARIEGERENGPEAVDAKLVLLLQSGDCNVI